MSEEVERLRAEITQLHSENLRLQSSQQGLKHALEELHQHQEELTVQNAQLEEARLALQVSRQRYQALFDYAPTGYLIVDVQGEIKDVNLTLCNLLQTTRNSLQQNNLWGILSTTQAVKFKRYLQRLFNSWKGDLETTLLSNEGTEIPVVVHGYLQDTPNFDKTLCHLAITDITRRKEIEAELQLWAHVFENAGWGLLLCAGGSHHIGRTNPAFARERGYTVDELQGAPLTQLFPLTLHEQLPNLVKMFEKQDNYSFESVHQRKDGSTFPVWIEVTTVRDENNHILYRITSVQDITQRKKIEQQLLEAKQAAEAANRAKSAFLANMSHELRTPLNAVMGYAQILTKAPDLSEKYGRMVNIIHRSSEHLLTLLNDILDLSKIEAGRYDLSPAPCELRCFLNTITDVFEARTEQKALSFQLYTEASLPTSVEIDERRVRQILMNLLSNAVKFTEQGTVSLSCQYQNNALLFAVRDTGIGIDKDKLEVIFNAFQQAGDSDYNAQGTGLGLAISRKLAQLMGGTLTVNSQLGEGSQFCLQVPAKVLDATLPTIEKSTSNDSRIVGYNRTESSVPFHVLIVDDIEINRGLLHSFLQPLGFIVRQTDSGESCLQILQDWHADLIFMDLKMRGLSGIQTTRRLRTLKFNMPIIAVSASAFNEDRAEALAIGCNDYIAKPINEQVLLNCIGRHLPLEWIYAALSVTSSTNTPHSSLSVEQYKSLQSILKSGDIIKLFDYLEELQKQPANANEAKKLLKLAKNFKLKELKEALQLDAS